MKKSPEILVGFGGFFIYLPSVTVVRFSRRRASVIAQQHCLGFFYAHYHIGGCHSVIR